MIAALPELNFPATLARSATPGGRAAYCQPVWIAGR